ncbi:MAG: hypothetical protein ABJT35_07820 [Parasphingorhabdus sp.]
MEFLSGFLTTAIMLFIGTVGSNFLMQTLRPNWNRRKHILWSSMLPPFGIWLLVTSVLLFSGAMDGEGGFEFFVPVIVLAITLPFVGGLIGIPTSWFILKQTKWKTSKTIDDIFG